MGQNIGRFEIRRELGRGAQSIVYLAWDPQLQREVAIKTMHFSRPDISTTKQLLAEARTVSKLRHPNVVPIFDAGEQDGDPYLIFEYVEGRPLDQVLKANGPMDPLQATELMRQIADALAEAHRQGIIHRDLKPSNIILDARGTARVMDFGIAMLVENAGEQTEKGLTGTPSYMAPEYLLEGAISAQSDIYAAGLILIEMLTGERVVKGGRVEQILYRVAHEPVALPPGVAQDDRLRDLLGKATARDRTLRYSSAAELRQALESFLGAGAAQQDSAAGAGSKQAALEFLLRRMRHKTDFPALSDSVAAINKLTDSDKESINKLSNTILKDFALTNKILRLVNSAHYRQAGGGSISTVSRAVVVLGFDVIRNIAITVLLFDHLEDKANARELKEAFLRANLAGFVARGASKVCMGRESEEVFICAMFHRLGQLLAQFYFSEEVAEIRKLIVFKHMSEQAASAQVLGISFEDLGVGIASSWGFPDAIVNSTRVLPVGKISKPTTSSGTLHVVAGFSNELCDMVATQAPEDRAKELKVLTARFGGAMNLSDRQLKEVLEKASEELKQMASVLKVNLKQSPFARQVNAWTDGGEDKGGDTDGMSGMADTLLGDRPVADNDDVNGSGGQPAPGHAESVLTAGIQDISNSLVEDFALNDILRIILETMYRAMGFKRVLLAIKDARAGQMVGRFGFGPDSAEMIKELRFPMAKTADVFQLSLTKALDIIIADIDDPKIADRIPKWFRDRFLAKTFVLFPLCIKGNPVALIYCDKDKAGSIVIPDNELKLLKTLRNQALLAIKQST